MRCSKHAAAAGYKPAPQLGAPRTQANLGATRPRVGPKLAMPTRGRVAPKLGRAPQLGRQIKHFTDTIRYSAKKRLPLHLLTDKGNR